MAAHLTADTNLVAFLRDFYSVGQLQLIYCTLTDGSPIPGMSEKERTMRTEAIRLILGKADPTLPAEATKSKKKR